MDTNFCHIIKTVFATHDPEKTSQNWEIKSCLYIFIVLNPESQFVNFELQTKKSKSYLAILTFFLLRIASLFLVNLCLHFQKSEL